MIATIAAFAVLSDAVLMHKDPEFDARAGLVSMDVDTGWAGIPAEGRRG